MASSDAFPMESFLGRLGSDALTAFDAAGRTRSYPKGTTIFYEGDDGHSVVAIRSGLAKVSMTSEAGREVILDVLGRGALLGELSAIDAGPRSATATSLNDVEAVVVTHERFLDLMQLHPGVSQSLLQVIAARLRDASRRQFEFGAGDALSRLCASLAELDDRYGTDRADGRVLELPFAQAELAAHAGLSREAVVKGLSALRSLSWVAVDRRTVTILDAEALRSRAGSSR